MDISVYNKYNSSRWESTYYEPYVGLPTVKSTVEGSDDGNRLSSPTSRDTKCTVPKNE